MKSFFPAFKPRRRVRTFTLPTVGSQRPCETAVPLPSDFRKKLRALARRHLFLNLGEGSAVWLRLCSALLLAQALADWWLGLPLGVRIVFLLMDLFLLGWLGWRGLYLPWKRRLDLAGAALLAQKSYPELRGALIASVQLADARTASTSGSPALVQALIQETAKAVRMLNFRQAASSRKFWHECGLCAFPTVLALTLAVWSWPASGALLGRIILLPLVLPTKTIVKSLTKDMSVPIGSDVVLSAQAIGVVPRQGRITLTYPGGRTQDVTVIPEGDVTDVFSTTLKNVQRGIRYQFSLNDGKGESHSVRPLEAPAIVSLECRQIWPAYTGLGEQKRDPANLTLLVGSVLKVRVSSSLPLKQARLHLEGLNLEVDMKPVSPDRKMAEGEIPIVSGLTGLSIPLTSDEYISSIKDSVYSIDVVPDKAPVVTLLKPGDESGSVTPFTKAQIECELSEDFGLASISLCYRIEAPPVPGLQDPTPSSDVRRREIPLKEFEPGHTQRIKDVWNLSAESPHWKEGWKVFFWIEAVDNNSATGPSLARTAERQWTILSPEAKRAELAGRLEQDADVLKQISARQEGASKSVGHLLETKSRSQP